MRFWRIVELLSFGLSLLLGGLGILVGGACFAIAGFLFMFQGVTILKESWTFLAEGWHATYLFGFMHYAQTPVLGVLHYFLPLAYGALFWDGYRFLWPRARRLCTARVPEIVER